MAFEVAVALALIRYVAAACLADAQSDRKAVVDGSPVKLATYSWESSRITTSIARIILEERMGLEVEEAAVLGGSHLGPVALAGGAGCREEDNFVACDVNNPRAHFIFDAWGGGEKVYDLMNSTIQPVIGQMGYMGREGTFVPDSAIQQGLARSPRAFLDFYKSYDSMDSDLTHFLASWSEVQNKIEELGLTKANCTRAEMPQAYAGCAFYEAATGDLDLYGWTSLNFDGNVECELVCEDNWIQSPACRRNPAQCVAWVTTGDGWGVEEMLQQAVFWNVALAVVVLPNWSDYTALPLYIPSLWFWFFPDPSFMALSPAKLQEPPTDRIERAARIYRTGADAIVLHKFLWRNLPTVSPKVHEFLKNVEFSLGDITEMMQNASLGQDLYSIACTWVKKQEARWTGWVPQSDLCAAGWTYNETTGTCQRCSSGRFSTGAGSANTSCQPCPLGSFSAALGSTTCEACPAGRVAGSLGQTNCQACDIGTYGANAGLSSCTRCSENHDQLLWATLRKLADVQGVERWVPVDGAMSVDACGCDIGSRWKDDGVRSQCIGCSTEGLECVGMGDLLIKEGYMSAASPVSVFKCFGDPVRCRGGLPGETCQLGRTGFSCSECIDGMTPSNDGSCTECEDADTMPTLAAMAFAISLIVGCYVMVDRKLRDTAAPSQVLLMASIGFGQLVSTVQQLSVMAYFTVKYEEPVSTFIQFFTIFAFDIEVLRIGCMGKITAAWRYTAKIFLLASVLVILMVTHILAVVILHQRKFQERKSTLIATISVIAAGLFTAAVVVVLGPIQCKKHPNGRYSMAAYEDIICWEFDSHPEQINMLVLSGVGIIIPLLFFGQVCHLVYVFPYRMQALDSNFLKSYGPVFLRFRPGAHWYALALLTRGLLVALIPIIRSSVYQIFSLQIVLLVSQATCFVVKPWRVNKMNYLDALFTIGMLFFSNLACASLETVDTKGVGYGVVLMMAMTICVVPCLFLYVGYVKFGPKPKQFQFFLCHAKAEAGCFCRLLKMELLEQPSVRREVFLDADNLDDLDKLLSYVAHDLDTLLILLTKNTLARAWCVGEVTVAHLRRIHRVPIMMSGCDFMSEDHLSVYIEHVPNLQVLTEYGLTVEGILEAMADVQVLEKILFPAMLRAGHVKDLAVQLSIGNFRGNISMEGTASWNPAAPSVVIIADLVNPEAMASAGIIKKSVAPKILHAEKSQAMEILEIEGHPLPDRTKLLLLTGTNGCLQIGTLLKSLFEAADRMLQVLPVVCEDDFVYPTLTMFQSFPEDELPQRLDGTARSRADIGVLLQDVFKEIAVVMRMRSAPIAMLEVAANEVASRILSERIHKIKASTFGEGNSEKRIPINNAGSALSAAPSAQPPVNPGVVTSRTLSSLANLSEMQNPQKLGHSSAEEDGSIRQQWTGSTTTPGGSGASSAMAARNKADADRLLTQDDDQFTSMVPAPWDKPQGAPKRDVDRYNWACVF